jgi:CMP-N-acetylneuraminic acid synthetase
MVFSRRPQARVLQPPRQTFPPAYHPNGYVEIIKTDFVRSGKGLFGPRVKAFVTPVIVEIDRMEEFEYLEYIIAAKGHPLSDHLGRNRA